MSEGTGVLLAWNFCVLALFYVNLDTLEIGLKRAARQGKAFYITTAILWRCILMLILSFALAAISSQLFGTRWWLFAFLGYLISTAYLYIVLSYSRMHRRNQRMVEQHPDFADLLYDPEKE